VASAEARIGEARPNVAIDDDADSGATRVSVFTSDREGLFHRICAGLAAAGANIIDARIHTTCDDMALDNLLVLDGRGQPYRDRRLRNRLAQSVERAITSPEPPGIAALNRPASKAGAFRFAPSVTIAEGASSRTTVVEVNALDRPGLLAALTAAISRCGHRIRSAHIATYGERAVDVFYVTGGDNRKLGAEQAEALRAALIDAAREAEALAA
jgi:[protein-PII] uridylyltransferase